MHERTFAKLCESFDNVSLLTFLHTVERLMNKEELETDYKVLVSDMKSPADMQLYSMKSLPVSLAVKALYVAPSERTNNWQTLKANAMKPGFLS